MFKEFIAGEEAGEILLSGKNYSEQQIVDIKNLFFDLNSLNLKNKKVLYADIKGNNLKWDPTRKKWVFIDTGARTPRKMFTDPDQFYDTFGKEFFFPSWISQTKEQLETSISQWKSICKSIISNLIGSQKINLEPACVRHP